MPVWERGEVGQEGKFSRNDFRFDKDNDLYVCPTGKKLRSTSKIYDGNTLRYRANPRPRCEA